MKTVAAFDFDGTITSRDTLGAFIRFSFGNRRFLLGLLRCMSFLVAYKCRLYPNWKAKQRLFGCFFSGMALGEFDLLCRAFYRARGNDLIRPAARECVNGHLRQGHDVVIVSASMDNWVLPFAESLGIKHVAGTQVEVASDGRLTGRFATPNCYGAEKVRRLLCLFPDRESYRLVAYGDSSGDRELLAYADEAYYKPFRSKKLS